MKFGRVLAYHHALSKAAVGELRHEPEDARVRVCAGDYLEQMQVARRIKEMGTQETASKLLGEALGDLLERNAAGIRRKDRPGLAHAIDALPESAFDVEILGNSLDDPIAIGDELQVMVEAARMNQRHPRGCEERCRLILGCVLNAFLAPRNSGPADQEGRCPGGRMEFPRLRNARQSSIP